MRTRRSREGRLLAIKFDDQLLVDRAINVIARRQSHDAGAHLCAIGRRDLRWPPTPRGSLPSTFDVPVLAARLFDRDRVARLHGEPRKINLAVVPFPVPV